MNFRQPKLPPYTIGFIHGDIVDIDGIASHSHGFESQEVRILPGPAAKVVNAYGIPSWKRADVFGERTISQYGARSGRRRFVFYSHSRCRIPGGCLFDKRTLCVKFHALPLPQIPVHPGQYPLEPLSRPGVALFNCFLGEAR